MGGDFDAVNESRSSMDGPFDYGGIGRSILTTSSIA